MIIYPQKGEDSIVQTVIQDRKMPPEKFRLTHFTYSFAIIFLRPSNNAYTVLMTIKNALEILRNRETDTAGFRKAADQVATILTNNLKDRLQEHTVSQEHLSLVIVLRSGMALLPAAITAFPHAPVGVAGVRRNEKTYEPNWYYEKMPPLSKKSIVVVLDPMLATGGSAETVISHILKAGVSAENMYFVGVLAAPEGVKRIATVIPKNNIVLAHVDDGLDDRNFIIPGLGDFGDRYFGFYDCI